MTVLCPTCKDKADCCNPLIHDMVNGILAAKGIVIALRKTAGDDQQKLINRLSAELLRIGEALDRCNK